jgi:RNA polymerase sigma factor (sigma-70 family)
MATAAVRGVLAAIRRSDADLLRRFAAGRDDAAFAELVRRHGPLVLGVCRRVVADRHLADDAFQAAFVVLARKAGGLDAGRPLGPWLYGVAFRVALRARLMIGRRRKRETLTAQVPDRPDEPTSSIGGTGLQTCGSDLSAIVDEEIARLSAVCREAVVLCEMQGLSRKEAAARLGVAEGTLSSRLAAARKTLAGRLRKRGVTLAGGLLGATALVPSELLASTVAVSTGKAELTPHLTTLIHGATHMGLLSKLKLAAVATAVFLLSAGGFGVWPGSESAAAPVPKEKDDTRKRNAPVPKPPPPEGVILATKVLPPNKDELVEVLGTDGNTRGHLPVGDLGNVQRARVSPDGKRLAFVRFIPLSGNQRGQYHYPQDVYVVDLPLTEPPKEATFQGVLDPHVAWAPDGKTLFVSSIPDGTDVSQAGMAGKRLPRKTLRYDAAAKKLTELVLPEGHEVHDVSPDGKTLLTRIKVWNGGFGKTAYSSFLVPLDTLKPIALGDEGDGFEIARFSPDGRRVVGTRTTLSQSQEPGVFLADAATGRVEKVPVAKEVAGGLVNGCVAWAPDGKRLAVLWEGPANAGQPAGGGLPSKQLVVMDTDGKNDTTIRTFAPNESAIYIEWADPKLADANKPAAPKK